MDIITASLRSSKVSASLELSRSMPSVSWVRSLEPMEMPSMPTSRNSSSRMTLEGTSHIIHILNLSELFSPSSFMILTVRSSSGTVRTKGIITQRLSYCSRTFLMAASSSLKVSMSVM